MRQLLKNLLIVPLLGLLFVACDGDEVPVIPEANVFNSGPSNSSNPYDSIGAMHNTLLIQFIDSVQCPENTTSNDIYNHFYVSGLPSLSDMVSSLEQVDYNTSGYTGYMDSIYQAHKNVWSYYLEIRDIVNNGKSLSDIIQNIIDYENTMDISGLNAQEQMAVYSAASVARYSSYMWSSIDEGGLGYLGDCQSNKYIADSRKVHTIVLNDIWGAFIGAFYGPAGMLSGAVTNSVLAYALYNV